MHPSQWKFEGRTLGIRCLPRDLKTKNGFENSIEVGSERFAPDWNVAPCCGGGLHWSPWGIAHDGQEHGVERPIWMVIEPIGDIVAIESKAKSEGVRVVFVGSLSHCMDYTHRGRVAYIESESTAQYATGYRSSAAATGYSSSAAATGYGSSAAATGYGSSAAATGYRSSAAATGYGSSAAATGSSTAAVCTGIDCVARAGVGGAIILGWYDTTAQRYKLRAGEIDGISLLPDVWYRLDAHGQFVAISEPYQAVGNG